MVWLKFTACVVIILFSGTKLAHYGDAIAERTGWGRIWIGVVLVAIVTSIPELASGLSAVSLVKSPDLATGDILGSCLYNLTILATIDILYRKGPVLGQASSRHIVPAAMSMVLIGIVAIGILASRSFPALNLGRVSPFSVLILAVYLVSVWWISRSESRRQSQTTESIVNQYREIPIRTMYLRFGLATAGVVGAGIWLAFIGSEMTAVYGWHSSFVGSLFLAISTSLPETAVAIACIRLGAIDLAVAEVLGSNMFDTVILLPVDILHGKEPFYSAISAAHLNTIVFALAMTLVVMAGIRLRPKRKTFRFFSWYVLVLFGLYVLGMYRVYVAN
jgi:cation:H+ antiporter